jgi:hypothetical protein
MDQKTTLTLILVFSLVASIAGFILVTPIGEGPDENAHLFYVRALQTRIHVPAIERLGEGPHAYEIHHPPTYYALAALWSRLTSASLDYPVIPNPGFPHSKRGGAFLPAPLNDQVIAAHKGIMWVRSLGILIGVAISLLLIQTAQYEAGARLGLLAAVTFVLAPQLAFICSLVSNDGLAILFSSATLLLGRRMLDQPSRGTAALMSLTGSLAIWTKASGAFLLAPLAVLALSLWRRGARLMAIAVVGPTFAAAAIYLLTWHPRFEIFKSVSGPMTGLKNHPELLIKYPFWAIQLWGSFFAKFGQFQLKLPWPFYFVFFPASLLVLAGMIKAWKQRKTWGPSIYWSAGILANLILLIYFWISVDFQHQGRLLWPSAACFVGCAAIAISDLQSTRAFPFLARNFSILFTLVLITYLATNLAGMGVIVRDEGFQAQTIAIRLSGP